MGGFRGVFSLLLRITKGLIPTRPLQMIYTEYLKTTDWQEKRQNKLSRKSVNRKRCSICASKNNLDVHHLNYKNLVDVEQSDLRILCRICHDIAHKLMKEGKIVFKNNNHHSKFAILKAKVKKELGVGNKNLFI